MRYALLSVINYKLQSTNAYNIIVTKRNIYPKTRKWKMKLKFNPPNGSLRQLHYTCVECPSKMSEMVEYDTKLKTGIHQIES